MNHMHDAKGKAAAEEHHAAGGVIETGYTRAQFAAAVDEAHEALHCAERAVELLDGREALAHMVRAHEVLHRVGAGRPRSPLSKRLRSVDRDREVSVPLADLLGVGCCCECAGEPAGTCADPACECHARGDGS